MRREDWTLVAIDNAGTRGLTPVQIQKVLFLLGKEIPTAVSDSFYLFIPHNYGPFSKQVYSDAERLAVNGLVAIERPIGGYQEYRITAAGANVARALVAQADPRAITYLRNVVSWAQNQTFSGLIRAIYNKYPEFRANSVFQG